MNNDNDSFDPGCLIFILVALFHLGKAVWTWVVGQWKIFVAWLDTVLEPVINVMIIWGQDILGVLGSIVLTGLVFWIMQKLAKRREEKRLAQELSESPQGLLLARLEEGNSIYNDTINKRTEMWHVGDKYSNQANKWLKITEETNLLPQDKSAIMKQINERQELVNNIWREIHSIDEYLQWLDVRMNGIKAYLEILSDKEGDIDIVAIQKERSDIFESISGFCWDYYFTVIETDLKAEETLILDKNKSKLKRLQKDLLMR